jgi:hypothetical protein
MSGEDRIELRLAGREVPSIFHLFGQHEDDMTYALGWALSRSPLLARRFMELAFGPGASTPTVIKLQETVPGHGRTDVELESDDEHLIVEAKRGWDVPREGQLEQYAPRLADGKQSRIVVLTEATAEHAAAHHLPSEVAGAPVVYIAWRQIADVARDTLSASKRPVERALLSDLHTYVRSFATMRDVTSNLVYVVSLGTDPLGESGLSFADVVMERDLYFCPVGHNGWPKDPPTYLGFRFNGQLQRVSYVRSYQVIADPARQGMPGLPELEGNLEWTGKDDKPLGHWLFSLDPAIPLPQKVSSGPHARNRRVTAALDLLLTSDTVLQAADRTRTRLDGASEAAPPSLTAGLEDEAGSGPSSLSWRDLGVVLRHEPIDRDRRPDLDPESWEIVSCGPRLLTTSPSGMSLRGSRWIVAYEPDRGGGKHLVCAELIKGYASGGREGMLRVLDASHDLEAIIAAIRSELDEHLESPEGIPASNNVPDIGFLSVEAVADGLNKGVVTGDPSWRELDELARSFMPDGPEDGWAPIGEPCAFTWSA